jgi:hypothetical protein
MTASRTLVPRFGTNALMTFVSFVVTCLYPFVRSNSAMKSTSALTPASGIGL